LRIRVLEVLASLRRAGAERVAVSIACGLDRDLFEAQVVSLYAPFPGGLEPELADRALPVWHLGKRRGLDPRMWPRLSGLLRRFRPQIVHTHSYVLNYVLPAWALARNGTLVHTVHNLAGRETTAIGRAIHRAAFRSGALPVAISPALARSFAAVYGAALAATIPNGVDTRRAYRPEARDAWRRANGFARGDLLVASVARFDTQKNPLGLIRVFARALGAGTHLVMAGEGVLLEESRRLAGSLGLAGRAHFLGLRQDVAELLSACDIFLLASEWEGAPVAVIEAMAARLPVVAPAVGGVPDLVENGVTGLLAPPGDAAALEAALAGLARDPERRRALGEAAARRAACFDASLMVERYAALFERACRGKR